MWACFCIDFLASVFSIYLIYCTFFFFNKIVTIQKEGGKNRVNDVRCHILHNGSKLDPFMQDRALRNI